MVNDARVSVPESVELVYRVVGNTHVFSSKGIQGLVHVGNHDREVAFSAVIPALNKHVSYTYSCEAAYKCSMEYEQFSKHIDAENDITANFFTVTLEKGCPAH